MSINSVPLRAAERIPLDPYNIKTQMNGVQPDVKDNGNNEYESSSSNAEDSAVIQPQPHRLALTEEEAREKLRKANGPKQNYLIEDIVKDPKPLPGRTTYIHVARQPDGKEVDVHSKLPAPIDLGTNIAIDDYAQTTIQSLKTVSQDAVTTVKTIIKKKWGLTVDPDNTFIVTFKYNTNKGKPYPAKIISKVSLTQALIKNSQNIVDKESTHVPYYKGGPKIQLVDQLERVVPGTFDLKDRISPGKESAHVTHTYQGVYANDPSEPANYGPSTQLPFSVDDLKATFYKSDFQQSHTEFLNDFWDKNDAKYPILVKASLLKAAHSQAQEGTLLNKDKQLLLRGMGLDPDQPAWADTTVESLQQPPRQDPDVSIGLLKIGRYSSTDIMVITDKKGEVKNGKTLHRTLLYVPGNSSPIHTFDSPEQMKSTLAAWAADPVKREALLQHFNLNERKGSVWHSGLAETLEGLGAWPEPGHRYKWDPDQTINVEPRSDPFIEVRERQRNRSYADSDFLITSKNDVNKATFEKYLSKAAMIALLFTPLAFVAPEAALALDVLAVASGAAEAGIGADDIAHGKPGGVGKLVFGVLNATLPVVARGLGAHTASETPPEPIEPLAGAEPHTPATPKSARAPRIQEPHMSNSQSTPANVTSTFPLKHEIGPNGQSVLVPEGIRGENPQVLRREKYTDVVVADKVYRYDPAKPDVLTELGSTGNSEPLEGFELKCGASGGRARRDTNGLCYTKWIEPGGTPVYQDAQALEHRRLVPSPEINGQPRSVIHDHRLFKVDPNAGDQLIEVPGQSPIIYRNNVSGSIIDEPDFGFDEVGLPRSINNDTVVVQLDQISDISNDQRTVRGYRTHYNGKDFVIVEGDTGVFYFAELTGDKRLNFDRITANNNPFSSRMIKLHDQYKDMHGYGANGTPNNDIVVLPGMDDLLKDIAAENHLSLAETQKLKNVLSELSDEKQRELLLNIRAWGKKINVPTALKPIALEPLDTPKTFNTLSPVKKNEFLAKTSREAIDRQFDATGIRSYNQRVPNDLADDARKFRADEIVTWLYTRTAAPNYSETILRVGGGNCDQMAHVAVDTINLSGGEARMAALKGHAFAVVGGPKGEQITSGFKGPEWADAWVVDPWAGISCPASDYRAQFEQRMKEWSASGKEIMINDGATPPQWFWTDPMNPSWINATTQGDAVVF